MSSRTTSGASAAAIVERRGAVVRDRHLVAVEPRAASRGSRPRRRCRRRPGCAGAARRPRRASASRPSTARRLALRRSGRRTTNSLPQPGPSLGARTRAAVQLDEALDEREPDAEAALRAVRACARPARTARRPRAASRARCRCRCRARRSPPRRPSLRHARARCARRRSVLGRVVEQVRDHLREPRRVAVDDAAAARAA